MVMRGENTGGDVFWCPKCGTIEDEDGENSETPESVSGGWWGCPGSDSYERSAATLAKFKQNQKDHDNGC